jgi:hypothetical protein
VKLTAQDIIHNMVEADPGLVETDGFVVYNPSTGEIIQSGHQGRSHTQALIDAGEPYALANVPEGDAHLFEWLATHYVDLETRTVRGKEPFPGILTDRVITGLPVPCRIGVEVPFQTGQGYWAPTWHDWADPDIEIAFDIPDSYRVTVESVRYLPFRFLVSP